MRARGCGCIERACGVPVLMLAAIAAIGAVLSLAAPDPDHAPATAGQRWALRLAERLVGDDRPVVARIIPDPMDRG